MSVNGEIEKETPQSTDLISFNININKEEVEYKFMIKSDEANMVLTIVKQEQKNKLIKFYERILDLNEIKSFHKNFSEFTSFQEFSKYIQNQNEKNNLEILIEYENLISVKLKGENSSLDFSKKEPKLDIIKNYFNAENCDLKKSIIELKQNKKLNEEIKDLKSINKKLKEENKNIIKELKIIKEEIEKLKKKNEDKQNIPNKNNQPENKLNKITSNKDKIISIHPINNNKNNNIKNSRIETGKNPPKVKKKIFQHSSKDKILNQVKVKK